MSTRPTDTQSVEHFVRRTLGCKCPDAVFKAITISRERSADTVPEYTRLLIGDRLLIYVLDTSRAQRLSAAVSTLATRGRAERDAAGLNRFRLVIATRHPTQALADAEASFTDAPGHDDRTHLHVIAPDQLPLDLRPS